MDKPNEEVVGSWKLEENRNMSTIGYFQSFFSID